MSTRIETLIKRYDELTTKARSLKTKGAQSKAWDKVREVEVAVHDVISGLYSNGQPLPTGVFTVLGIVSGMGAINDGRSATVLDVYLREIVVSVPTSEYPNGEVFRVPFLECGKLGRLNLNKLVGIV